MKYAMRVLPVLAAVAAIAAGAVALSTRTEAAPTKTSKTVTIACRNGWRGSAGGSYGGVSFGVDCATDRSTTDIEGVDGTAYSIRMGAENFAQGAVDCFFSGDDANVAVSCGEVRITIH